MSKQPGKRKPGTLLDEELRQLEVRVHELVQLCKILREENASLRARQDALVVERASLIEKNELSRTRVESMVTRLKAMESGS